MVFEWDEFVVFNFQKDDVYNIAYSQGSGICFWVFLIHAKIKKKKW